MTICIAAVCDDGNTVVVAADRMVTVPGLNLEVESPRSKIAQVSKNQILMSSGDGLLAVEILHDVLKTHAPAGPAEIDISVKHFLDAYVALRLKRVEEMFTQPIGYDLGRFQTEGMKNLGPLYMQAIQGMSQFNLGADFLFVGFDEQKARVAVISHPGTMRWLDSQESYAIGSGAMHAVTSLMLSGHASRWSREQALLSIYAAKRVAERAPGVGNSTDLQVVVRDGIMSIGEETFRVLERMYKAQTDRAPVSDYAELKDSIDGKASA